ncbi:GOLPH3/VPS74 family protein [Actinopolymorpha singaporensis]|uniref:Golgi phosphoprotein 3 (GPP34) n=1 Tax=Actinopolymorpha singaporensis TaxID=117157 RepID=A0A1H1WEE5_9ACTN|nr:GPP34 family phosphoprotein [Actinopolymorpha singaporensis]SDS95030.1 Golgi phosphoprotein 3 (GPP34) [Actinopolymorpha singaporensis]
MLLAEDLLLLLVDDSTGRPVTDGTKLDHALAGAVLLELTLRGKVDVAGPGEDVRKGRLVVRDESPTGEPVLDQGLSILDAREGSKPANVLGRLAKGLRDRLLAGLADRGVLRQEKGRVLGIFPTTRWPAEDSSHENSLRVTLSDVLVQGRTPDARTGALVSLLAAIDVVPKVVDAPDRRAVRRRAREISEGAWAADAVKKAVAAVNAATMAAVSAATTAAASSTATN